MMCRGRNWASDDGMKGRDDEVYEIYCLLFVHRKAKAKAKARDIKE